MVIVGKIGYFCCLWMFKNDCLWFMSIVEKVGRFLLFVVQDQIISSFGLYQGYIHLRLDVNSGIKPQKIFPCGAIEKKK